MTYQVLARKWRPKRFADMVGQAHVIRALANALDSGRLHHAYLFTGTRGVGKTTLARILAKALNCETGVSSEPCGSCPACQEVDEGRFVDLLEVDAASRTKVDETRDLLDNVQYSPTRGRYKIYLIDEVHMFSNHSFNALLKTLEEPPPHVKFLLATTDPKKLPVTILSRCLQFNLSRVGTEAIATHLEHILGVEEVPHEPPALRQIAAAADGSVRDALSLLDQAIAYCGGELALEPVAAMLGTVSGTQILGLVDALAAGDGVELLKRARTLADSAPDFSTVLNEMMVLLQRIAVVQVLGSDGHDLEDDEEIARLAGAMSPEQCQLCYQIGTIGRRDLYLAPDPVVGFEMILLRMLAFRPATSEERGRLGGGADNSASKQPGAHERAPAQPNSLERLAREPVAPPPGTDVAPPPNAPRNRDKEPEQEQVPGTTTRTAAGPGATPGPAAPTPTPAAAAAAERWSALIDEMGLAGLVRELANNCALLAHDEHRVKLALDPQVEQMLNPKLEQRLAAAVKKKYGDAVTLEIIVDAAQAAATPAAQAAAAALQRQRDAEQAIEADTTVQGLKDLFDARVEQVTVKP